MILCRCSIASRGTRAPRGAVRTVLFTGAVEQGEISIYRTPWGHSSFTTLETSWLAWLLCLGRWLWL
jgi:hypothetical protein